MGVLEDLRPKDVAELRETLKDARPQRLPKDVRKFMEEKSECERLCVARMREAADFELGLLLRDYGVDVPAGPGPGAASKAESSGNSRPSSGVAGGGAASSNGGDPNASKNADSATLDAAQYARIERHRSFIYGRFAELATQCDALCGRTMLQATSKDGSRLGGS